MRIADNIFAIGMKKLLFVIAFLLSCVPEGIGQGIIIGSSQPKRVIWDQSGRIQDSIFVLPVRDTANWTYASFRSIGRITVRPQDSLMYFHNGDKWVAVGSGSGGGGGTGTVTSVGLSLPTIFTVTNSPVTTNGTLTGALVNQAQNSVLAGPVSGSGSPTFRLLAVGDIPALPYVPTTRTLTINGNTQDLSANRTWTFIDSTVAGWGLIETNNSLRVDTGSTGVATQYDLTQINTTPYSAGTGIGIVGTTISNTGDLSSTNELQSINRSGLAVTPTIGGTGFTLPDSVSTTERSNWNAAHNDKINSAAFTGATTKTLTLNQQDGGTVTANFTDDNTTYTAGWAMNLIGTVFHVDSATLKGMFYKKSQVDSIIAATAPDGSETKVIAGTNTSVTGTGTIANPYVINASGGGTVDTYVEGGDSITVTGDGTIGDPFVVSYSGTFPVTSVNGQTGDVVLDAADVGALSVEVDGDITNELQTISKVGSTVTLSDGGGSFTDDTGTVQTLSYAYPNLSISGGNTVTLPDSITAAQKAQWDTAYVRRIVGKSVTGTTTKTIRDTLGSGQIISASFTDMVGETYVDGGTDISVTGTGTVGDPYVVSYTGTPSAFDTTHIYAILDSLQRKTDTNTYDATKYWVMQQGFLTGFTEVDPTAPHLVDSNTANDHGYVTLPYLLDAISDSVAGAITQTITNGDVSHSPSGDAVFDALALKLNHTYSITGTSGTSTGAVLTDTINQSGTAAYSALDMNITETATGSGTSYFTRFRRGGTQYFGVRATGLVEAAGISSYQSSSQALVSVSTAGTSISRNIADANPALIVQQVHASSTGDLIQIKNNSTTPFSISQAGKVKIADGTQSNGYILSTNGSGVASWIAPPDLSGYISFSDTVSQIATKYDIDTLYAGIATPGIDVVLAEAESLTANRTIDLDGNNLEIDASTGKILLGGGTPGTYGIEMGRQVYMDSVTTGNVATDDVLMLSPNNVIRRVPVGDISGGGGVQDYNDVLTLDNTATDIAAIHNVTSDDTAYQVNYSGVPKVVIGTRAGGRGFAAGYTGSSYWDISAGGINFSGTLLSAGNAGTIVVTTDLDTKADKLPTVNVQTGTTYTLQSTDNNNIITCDNASDITLNVPTGLPVGFNCLVIQKGLGQVIITPSSTTVNNRQSFTKSAGQFAPITIVSYATDIFMTGGDME